VSHAGTSPRDALWLLACGALGVWIGVHVLRTYLVSLIWYVSRDATTPEQIGIISLGVFSAGLLGGIASRFLGDAQPAWRFGALVTALIIASQTLPVSATMPAIPFAAWVAWLWWCPAFLQEMSRRGASHLIVPSVVLGLAAQGAGQTALHGLDLPLLSSVYGIIGSVALAGAFMLALIMTWPRQTPGAGDIPVSSASSPWAALAIGPYLHLQLTLLANVGGLQTISGWGLLPVALVAGISMSLALAALRQPLSRAARLACGLVALLALVTIETSGGWAILAVIPAQVALTALFHGTTEPIADPRHGAYYSASATGWIVFFLLFYGFYAVNVPFATWIVGLVVVTGASMWRSRPSPIGSYRLAGTAALVVAAGLGMHLGAILVTHSMPDHPESTPSSLRVMTYNVHQGFDARLSPSMPEIADLIERADADLIALQEVHRGANVAGGADLIAYLDCRFPDHHILFGPSYTRVMGNAILSRYPIIDWGWEFYPPGQTILTRGYVWVTIDTNAGHLMLVNTHLSSAEEPDETRIEQVNALLAFWDGRPRTIIAGDMNAIPASDVIASTQDSGLIDSTTALDRQYLLEPSKDWDITRIDYVFTSPDIEPLVMHVVFSSASDHPAVITTARIQEP
jgi:endonuclease/exonuclease/phosphatase family metal-dependent hydrolase